LAREAVFVAWIAFHQAAERRAGDDALVAIECVFVFLIQAVSASEESIQSSGAQSNWI